MDAVAHVHLARLECIVKLTSMIVSLVLATIMEHVSTKSAIMIVFARPDLLVHDAKVISTNVYQTHAQVKAPWTAFNWLIIITVTANPAMVVIIVRLKSIFVPHLHVKMVVCALQELQVTTANVKKVFMENSAKILAMIAMQTLVLLVTVKLLWAVDIDAFAQLEQAAKIVKSIQLTNVVRTHAKEVPHVKISSAISLVSVRQNGLEKHVTNTIHCTRVGAEVVVKMDCKHMKSIWNINENNVSKRDVRPKKEIADVKKSATPMLATSTVVTVRLA